MIEYYKNMRRIFLFFVLLFPVNIFAGINTDPESDNIENSFSITERNYLRRYVLQSSAFLIRAVGKSPYSLSILGDPNDSFVLEQSMNFYKKFDIRYLPRMVQEYLYQCFLINRRLLENNNNYFKIIILLNKKKVIENQFYNNLKKYGYDWNNILSHFIEKNQRDVMKQAVKNSFEKFTNNGTVVIDPNDTSTMEIIIKNAYIEFADYLDEESRKE